MNTKILATSIALACSGTALAGIEAGPSISIDVLAVNGIPSAGQGVVDSHTVMQGDVITFAVVADISTLTSDALAIGNIRLADVGPFGTVNPASFDVNPILGNLVDPTDTGEPAAFGDNGLNIKFFEFPGGNSLGPTAQIFTFEFLVTANSGFFAYDTLQDPPLANNPDNALETFSTEYLLERDDLFADTIIIPAPGAGAIAIVAGIGLAGRRRR